jgi:hypothetical protein
MRVISFPTFRPSDGPDREALRDGVGNAHAASIEEVADWDDLGPAFRYLAASPARCAALAEEDAGRVVDLVGPGVALAFMPEAQLLQIVAADVAEVVRTRDAFREAAAAAQAVLDVLQAADARLLCAITAAVPRGGLATP